VDMSLLCTMLTSVTTYIIVLVQFKWDGFHLKLPMITALIISVYLMVQWSSWNNLKGHVHPNV
jgi:hypothetical protein